MRTYQWCTRDRILAMTTLIDGFLFLFLYNNKKPFCWLIDPAGVREKPEGGAALHLRMAACFLLAQGARLPLPW